MASCSHVEQIRMLAPPAAVEGCEECLAEGRDWVHLRMCQTCGHVGCCDDSPGRHATAHHQWTGHPIMRSLEPGEDWSWCFVDQAPVELGEAVERDDLPEELNPRHIRRRLIQLALLAVLTVGVISLLPGLGDVRERFRDASVGWLAVAGFVELLSCLSYVAAFRGIFCRGMGWRFSYELGMAEQATNVLLPVGGAGGLALGAWALRQGGMDTGHIGRRSVAFFLITSTPNFVTAALFGFLLAAGALPGRHPLAPTLTLAGLAVAAIVLVASLPALLGRGRPRSGGQAAGRLRRAARTARTTVTAGVEDSVELLVRSRDPLVVGGSLGYMAFDVLALAAAFEAFGGGPPLGAFVFAYVIGQLGGLIPLPGGIGGTDGGLIGALVLYGTPLSQATAAVLAYRAFQLGIPALLGTVAFVQLRRTLARHPAPAALCHPLGEPLHSSSASGVAHESPGVRTHA